MARAGRCQNRRMPAPDPAPAPAQPRNPLHGLTLEAIVSALAAHYGWRTALLVAAAPGLVLAALLLVLVREPVRGASEASAPAPAAQAPTLADTLGFIRGQRALLELFAASVLVTAASSAIVRVRRSSCTMRSPPCRACARNGASKRPAPISSSRSKPCSILIPSTRAPRR